MRGVEVSSPSGYAASLTLTAEAKSDKVKGRRLPVGRPNRLLAAALVGGRCSFALVGV